MPGDIVVKVPIGEHACEECLRRSSLVGTPPPEPVEQPDFAPVIHLAKVGVAEIVADGYLDEDTSHYIFEAVMIAVYGKDYFKWHNASLR